MPSDNFILGLGKVMYDISQEQIEPSEMYKALNETNRKALDCYIDTNVQMGSKVPCVHFLEGMYLAQKVQELKEVEDLEALNASS